MSFHRSAAVVASAVILTGGAVVAVNAVTTTDPVTLCRSLKTNAVSAPSSGVCPKGSVGFDVANDADVQGLITEIDELRSNLNPLEVSYTIMAGKAGYSVYGTGLQPGSEVAFKYTEHTGEDFSYSTFADAEGNAEHVFFLGCVPDPVVSGIEGEQGLRVYTERLEHPLCSS